MKTPIPFLSSTFAVALLSATPVFAGEQMTRLDSKPLGAKVRIEGTSTIHDWQVESKLIGGFLEAGQNFPIEPGQDVKPGKVEANADIFIPVGSLKSIDKDGSPGPAKMNTIMNEH